MANKMTSEQVNRMCESAKSLGFRPDRLKLLDERLTEWCRDEMTPSIVARVMRHGELAFEAAYGIKGPGMETDSLTADTIFPVCSMTKPVTAALLCIMQEEGLLDLNKPVRNFISEFTGDEKNDVRIWHLLTHTSGLLDQELHHNAKEFATRKLGIPFPEYDDDMTDEARNEAALKIREKMGLPYMEPGEDMMDDTYFCLMLASPPTHKPQKVMHYCNTGYGIAGMIIKRVTGMPMDRYASERLFNPLKMNDSHYILPRGKLPRYIQRGVDYVGSEWLNAGVLEYEHGAGGLKSTVTDMTRFGQMFLNHGRLDGARVLSPSSVREITTDHNPKVPPAVYEDGVFESSWGLGWNIKGIKKDDSGILLSPRTFEHGGMGCCRFFCDPDADVVAAYFTVCKTNCYWNAGYFNNMVLGAIDDYVLY